MKRIAKALMLFALVASQAALAGPKEDAIAAYMKFFQAFTPDNHDMIVTLFAPDAQFFGTLSTDAVTETEGIRKYFVSALNSSRGTVAARPFEQTATVISDGVVLVAGKWQSERTLDGKMTTAGPSRNTVVMQKRGDRWLIVQFHNSPTPKPSE